MDINLFRAVLDRACLSQRQAARQLGMPEGSLRGWLSGKAELSLLETHAVTGFVLSLLYDEQALSVLLSRPDPANMALAKLAEIPPKTGRPRALTPAQENEIVRLYRGQGLSKNKTAAALGITPSMVFRTIQRFGLQGKR